MINQSVHFVISTKRLYERKVRIFLVCMLLIDLYFEDSYHLQIFLGDDVFGEEGENEQPKAEAMETEWEAIIQKK